MRRYTGLPAAALAMVLAACGEVSRPTDAMEPSLARAGGEREQVIVVFRSDVANPRGLAQQLAAASGGELAYTYEHAIKGMAGSFPSAALDGLRRNPNVAYIEPDGEVTISTTQSNATWGLDRIDQRDRPLNGTYTYDPTGAGVRAYIIDTGIRASHGEFSGRMLPGYDAVTSGGSADDCNGHGTHVAGTVGGTVYGVAKQVHLVPVRVLNCQGSGTISGVVAGVDWVRNNFDPPAVANMSLGGGASSSLDQAVANAVAAGVTFVVAAGNSNRNACNYSPARVASAITVGATTSSDARASYSNYGSCLDLFAPGSSITSAWHTSNSATNTISGTSMASPHVAGVAALYLQGAPTASPATVTANIVNNASTNKVTSPGTGSPNRLLYMAHLNGAAPPPENQPPTASFTAPSCTVNVACTFDGSGSSDPEGGSLSYSWAFGDGTTGNTAIVHKTYTGEGPFTVTLTVTDNGGLTGQVSKNVTVSASSSPTGISLEVTGYKVRGTKMADLAWSGATSANVDIYFDGAKVTTTGNDGAYTHDLNSKGGGSHTFRVCEAGTNTCSNVVTVTY